MNSLMTLYHAIGDFETVLEHKNDYFNDGVDERTDLEKEMHPLLSKLWDLCRQHPQFSEPTHETHPHLISEDGDIRPFTLDTAKERRITGYKEAIEAFCRETGTSKKAFAEAYGCTPSYISRILKGEKAANHDNFVMAFHNLGYMPKANQEDWVWTWEKISPFL